MTIKYKFQIKNGSIYDGNTIIIIKDYIAVLAERPTVAIESVIEAYGGLLVIEEKPKSKKKRKVKPVKWGEKEAVDETIATFEKVKKMTEEVE